MSLLPHDRYQYDSLILSKQTWAHPRHHLQKLLWCVVSVRWNWPEVEERKLCRLRYYANCVFTTLTVLILHNVESVYFFYSNAVYMMSVCIRLDMLLSYYPQVIYWLCYISQNTLLWQCRNQQWIKYIVMRYSAIRCVVSMYMLISYS